MKTEKTQQHLCFMVTLLLLAIMPIPKVSAQAAEWKFLVSAFNNQEFFYNGHLISNGFGVDIGMLHPVEMESLPDVKE